MTSVFWAGRQAGGRAEQGGEGRARWAEVGSAGVRTVGTFV